MTIVAGTGLALAGPSNLASAQDGTPDVDAVIGDFTGDGRDDLFVFDRTTSTGYVVAFNQDSPDQVNTTSYLIDVPPELSERHRIVAGDFNGQGAEELLWYVPGEPVQDPDDREDLHIPVRDIQRWTFTNPDDPAEYTSDPLELEDNYGAGELLVGDFSHDGIDDVFGHVRSDHEPTNPAWVFDGNGDPATTVGLHQPAPDERYDVTVGSFGDDAGDDLIWHTTAADATAVVWDFTGGDALAKQDSEQLPADGEFLLLGLDRYGDDLPGNDSVIWYEPGDAPDNLWDFEAGVLGPPAYAAGIEQNGNHSPFVAGDLLGDGSDDVVWFPADGNSDGNPDNDPDQVELWNYAIDDAGQVPDQPDPPITLPWGFWTQRTMTVAVPAG